jgi:uncharacterized protein YbbK (DUF523 family)
MKSHILVSACLMGFCVRYDSLDKPVVLDTLSRRQEAQRRKGK